MKKCLLVLALVGLFFSCSSVPSTPEDFQSQENKSFQDYLLYGEYNWAYVNLVNIGLQQYIVELDTANNIIGMSDRELAVEKGRDDFLSANFRFWSGTGFFYFDVGEGSAIASGSLADCVTVKEELGSDGELNVNLKDLLAKSENAGVGIGDEVFKITMYTDATKTDVMDTFTFIL